MNRHAGELPTISQEKYPARFVVFDTEAWRADPVNGVELQTLRLGVAKFVELGARDHAGEYNNLCFHTCEELGSWLEWLTRKDHTLYVYCHNIKYDLQLTGLFTWLVSQGWQATLFVIEDPPTFIKMKRGRMSLTLVDTFNYWQTSVYAMGEQLGIPKLPMPTEAAADPVWFEYCKRDVEVLTAYLLKFIDFLQVNDLCGLGLTLASQAFRSYRYRFMPTPPVLHNDAHALTLERDGYYGGRCEAFHIGDPADPPYYKLDVNSMYPYVMQAYTYPVELVAYSEDLSARRLGVLLDNYYCLADVDLDTMVNAYPFTNGEKLLFPVGSYRGILHHSELERAYKRGEVKHVNRLAIYTRGDLFTRYVDYFYALKVRADREGDKITRHQAKIFMNSLYGKFGQRMVVSRILPVSEGLKYERLTGFSEALHRNVEVNYLGNAVEIRYKAGEAYYSAPVVAGAVTSYARSYLYDLIMQAGRSNVYYVDTDSLTVNQAGYDNLSDNLDPDRLGALKLEGQADLFYIHGAKDYIFGGEVKVKGVPKSAVKLSDNLWEYQQFRGGKTWISVGCPTGVEVYTREKIRRGTYDKGVVLAGGEVLPLRFGLVDSR